MKSFIKFIVTILVVAVVGYIVYFITINGNKDNYENLSGDSKSGDIFDIYSGEIGNQDFDNTLISGDVSGEIIDVISGEIIDPITLSINRIDAQAEFLYGAEMINTISDNFTKDILSESARSFLEYFNANELPVTVNIRDRVIEVIPNSDFLENMVYYYNENGELILYELISTTVGGSSKYYFENNDNISIKHNYDEPSIVVKDENTMDILLRAERIYDKFLM